MKEEEKIKLELSKEEAQAFYVVCDIALKAAGVEALGPAVVVLSKLAPELNSKKEEVEDVQRK